MSWSTSLACPASSAEGIPGSLISSRQAPGITGQGTTPGSSRAGLSVPGDGRGSSRPDLR